MDTPSTVLCAASGRSTSAPGSVACTVSTNQASSGPESSALNMPVTAAARANGRWVGVCGELAGDPDAAVILAGLGVTELSMAAARIPEVKQALREVTFEEARRRALETGGAAALPDPGR